MFFVNIYVKGYIFVIFISKLINFVLSFRRLTVVSEVSIELFRDIVTPLLCVIASCFCTSFINQIFSFNLGAKAAAAYNVILCAFIYLILLRIFQAVDKEETQWFKGLLKGKKS